MVPGTSFIYTIVAKNNGPSDSPVTLIHDTFPTGVTVQGYTAAGTGGATGFTAVGAGTINDAAVNMPAGSTVTYMVTVNVSPTATGTISNTAIIASAVDSNPANNSATDTDVLTPQADLSITKIDDHGGSSITPSTGTVIPGQNPLIYTIVVTNNGPIRRDWCHGQRSFPGSDHQRHMVHHGDRRSDFNFGYWYGQYC